MELSCGTPAFAAHTRPARPRRRRTPLPASAQRRRRQPCVCLAADSGTEAATTAAARLALLRAVALAKRDPLDASRRRGVLAAVAALERCVGVAAPTGSPMLDGRWSLLFTASDSGAGAGDAGDADALGLRAALQAASDTAYKFFYARLPFIAGAAPAGTRMGTARTTGTWQTIDRAAARVENAAQLELLPGTRFTVLVGGSAVAATPTRLDVTFLDFTLELGQLRLALPLSLLAPRGSVETTFLDDALRIGRGDKGSVFVCARDGSSEAREDAT